MNMSMNPLEALLMANKFYRSNKRQNGLRDEDMLMYVDPEQAVPREFDYDLFMMPTMDRYLRGRGPGRRLPDIQKPGIDG